MRSGRSALSASPHLCECLHFPDDDAEGRSGGDTCSEPLSWEKARGRIGALIQGAASSFPLQRGIENSAAERTSGLLGWTQLAGSGRSPL